MSTTDAIKPPGWHIRPYAPGDEIELLALFSRVFGQNHAPSWWLWKLKGSSAAGAPFENVWVAVSDEDGSLTGQYAGIPVRLKLAGREYSAVVSVDTMTSPDFRRQGILTGLGAAAYSAWASAGVAAVAGLPNEQWGTRLGALGWKSIAPLEWLRLPLDPARLLARKLPAPLTGPARLLLSPATHAWQALLLRRLTAVPFPLMIEEVGAAGPEFDRLWRNLRGEYGSLVVRDSARVNWRYLQSPERAYTVLLATSHDEPLGYLAFALVNDGGRRVGHIVDLFTEAHDRATARSLLSAALSGLASGGAEMALALALPGSPLHATLKSAGFTTRHASFDFALAPLDPGIDLAALANPDGWLVTGGDFDVM